jgi:AcrR family transcriptional regulator
VQNPVAAFSSATDFLPSPHDHLVWRSDLDPVALPASTEFTASQRAILHACVEHFAESGYSGTTVRDVAGSVGIKSASLYKSFVSKQAMLDALNNLGHAEFNRRQVAALLDAGDDPRDQLVASVRALVEVACAYPRLSWIVNTEVSNLSAAGFKRDQYARQQAAQMLHQVIERGQARGLFLVPDPIAVTILIWGLGVALAGWFPYAPAFSVNDLADSYSEIVLRVVGATAPSHAVAPSRDVDLGGPGAG